MSQTSFMSMDVELGATSQSSSMAGQLGVLVHVGASAEDAVAVAVDGGGSAVVGGVRTVKPGGSKAAFGRALGARGRMTGAQSFGGAEVGRTRGGGWSAGAEFSDVALIIACTSDGGRRLGGMGRMLGGVVVSPNLAQVTGGVPGWQRCSPCLMREYEWRALACALAESVVPKSPQQRFKQTSHEQR